MVVSAIIAFAIATAIAFLTLRNKGGTWRHLIAFFLAAIVAAFLTILSFELMYPYSGAGSVASDRRYAAVPLFVAGGIAAAFLGPILGMVLARRKRAAKSA